MAGKIDDRTFQAVRKAYLESASKPDRKRLASTHGIGLSTINNWAAQNKWEDIRKTQQAARETGKIEGAKAISQHRKVDDLTALDHAIADLSGEGAAVESKSKEGCYTALANLLKTKRELYPPTAEELAEIAVKLDISPADFIRALRAKWQDVEQQQQSA